MVNFRKIYKNTQTGRIGIIQYMMSDVPGNTLPATDSINAVVIAGHVVSIPISAPWVEVGEINTAEFPESENGATV